MRDFNGEHALPDSLTGDDAPTFCGFGDTPLAIGKYRLALVVKSPIRRESLHLMLSSILSEFTVNSCASLEQVPREGYGILLLCEDSVPEGLESTLRYIESVKKSYSSFLLIVMADNDNLELAAAVLRGGASGYVFSTIGTSAFVAAVRLVMAGGMYVPASLVERWASAERSSAEEILDEVEALPSQAALPNVVFTRRELDVLDCLQSGQPNKIIAYSLKMSESTVKVHMRNIMRKIGATNRTQVAFFARRSNTARCPQSPPLTIDRDLTGPSSERCTTLNRVDRVTKEEGGRVH